MYYIKQVLKYVYEKEHVSFSCETLSLKNHLLELLNAGTNWILCGRSYGEDQILTLK